MELARFGVDGAPGGVGVYRVRVQPDGLIEFGDRLLPISGRREFGPSEVMLRRLFESLLPQATDAARMIRNITRRRAKLLKTMFNINFSRLGFYEKPPQFARI